MKSVISVFLCWTILAGYGHCENEDDGQIKFSQLPSNTQTDFFNILTGVANAFGGSCIGIEPNYDQVELLLFTSDDSNSYAKLNPNNPGGMINNDSPLYLLTHGWLSGLNGYKIKAFRNTYIKLYGKNIIFFNWGQLAMFPYEVTACNIPFLGQYVANFLCALSEKQGYDLNKVHMIGHSMGGHLAGFTGKGVQKLCSRRLGRVTALDPAGPYFQFAKESHRLVPTDAAFVEVVHSNAGLFGYLGKAGTVDYHLNCGSNQPGCLIPEDFSKIMETSIFLLACSHMRALEIWPYVLQSDQFKAKSCTRCPFFVAGACVTNTINPNFISLGRTYTKPKYENYNLITHGYPPFHLGCHAYPFQGCV